MIYSSFKKQKGVTLIELIVTLSILVIVIGVVFSIFLFGNNTFSSGRDQFDLQSGIRTTSDVLRNKLKYASELTIMPAFDPSTMDNNYNYIYLSGDKKHIIYKEGANTAVDLLNVGSSDMVLNITFIKGSISADAIRFSNTIASASTERTLKYTLSSTDISSGKIYDLANEVTLMNVSFLGLAPNVLEGPTVLPEEGLVLTGTSIALSAESGADIYYTLDNSLPSIGSTKYTAPIIINADKTIKAIAIKNGITSSVAEYYFTVTSNPNPIVSDVTIEGSPVVGSTIEVNYSFISPALASQGPSKISWFGANKLPNHPQHSKTLIITKEYLAGDLSRRTLVLTNTYNYIYVEIVPIDSFGRTGTGVFAPGDFGKVN